MSIAVSPRIIIIGKGGAGKDFLRKKFQSRGFVFQVSYTTRPPRVGEVDGKDYHFISQKQADDMTKTNEWLECVTFNSWTYGTTKAQFAQPNSVFIMTPSGLTHLSQSDRASSFVIFLDPPTATLDVRLKARNMPGDSYARRRQADEEAFSKFSNFDVRIANDNF